MHPRLRDFGKFIDNLEVYKVHGTFEHLYSPATDEIFVSFVGFDNNQKVISKLWRWPESTVASYGPLDPLQYRLKRWDKKLNKWIKETSEKCK